MDIYNSMNHEYSFLLNKNLFSIVAFCCIFIGNLYNMEVEKPIQQKTSHFFKSVINISTPMCRNHRWLEIILISLDLESQNKLI